MRGIYSTAHFILDLCAKYYPLNLRSTLHSRSLLITLCSTLLSTIPPCLLHIPLCCSTLSTQPLLHTSTTLLHTPSVPHDCTNSLLNLCSIFPLPLLTSPPPSPRTPETRHRCLANPTLPTEEAVKTLTDLHADGYVGVRFNPYLFPDGMSSEVSFYCLPLSIPQIVASNSRPNPKPSLLKA